jgi:type I restriction enzyme S subunit
MSDWPITTLGDVFDISRGGSPRPIDDFITEDPVGINWIMIGDALEGSKYITGTKKRIRPEGARRSRSVKPGDFLLTNSMSFGRPYIMRTAGCIHDGWLVLSPRRDDFDADFFYHLLGSNAVYSEFERRAAGATVKNLNIDLVRGVKIPLPPLHEQRRIAQILDKADALRAKRRAAVVQLDNLIQSIFLVMFGDPAANRKEWPHATLRELGNVKTGGTPPSAKAGMFGGPIPFVTPGDLESDAPVKRSVTEAGAAECETVRPGATLVCCIGATIGKIGRVEVRSAFNQQINAVEWGESVHDTYGYAVLRFFKPTIIAWGASTTLPILKKSAFEKIEIPVPTADLQAEFAARSTKVDELGRYSRTSLGHCDELFASLRARAFKGEL